MSNPKQTRKALASHVIQNEEFITDELVDEAHKLSLMKRSKYLQPSYMVGHLDPYKSYEDVENVLKSINDKKIPVNLVLGSKVYGSKFEGYEKLTEDMEQCQLTPMQGALWSYYEFPEEFAKILDEYFQKD